MSWRRLGPALGALLAPLGALGSLGALGALGAGCDTYAAGSYLVDKLKPSLSEKLGAIDSITCPERILVQNTTVFSCDVTAGGRSGSIKVTLDHEGGLKWETQ